MPSADIVRYALAAVLCVLLGVAAITDMRQRRIPNWVVLGVVVLFAAWTATLEGAGLASGLMAAGIATLVAVPLYACGVVGAGDSKLFMALAMFAGMAYLKVFGLVTVLAGGALAFAVLASHPTRTLAMLQTRGRGGSQLTVPYGVAIALAGVFVMSSKLGLGPYVPAFLN